MKNKSPVMTSFFALTNGQKIWIHGQIVHSKVSDLTFRMFSTWRMVRSMVNMYRSNPMSNKTLKLGFDRQVIHCKTDERGAFEIITDCESHTKKLMAANTKDGNEITLAPLYSDKVRKITNGNLLISDVDDTILDSFIKRKLKKIRAMLFTKMEKRTAVEDIKKIITEAGNSHSETFYLSNSEENLFPLISSFLDHNDFPPGPVFLKKFRKVKDLLLARKHPSGNSHKITTLQKICLFFEKSPLVLIGDNTQQDLSIYLQIAKEFSGRVRHIIIREVKESNHDEKLIRENKSWLQAQGIQLHHAPTFEQIDLN